MIDDVIKDDKQRSLKMMTIILKVNNKNNIKSNIVGSVYFLSSLFSCMIEFKEER